jgi:hypothetical protein
MATRRTRRAATNQPSIVLFDREQVRLDIGLVMRDVVVRSTPFTVANYTGNIVPSKGLPAGWEASLPNWAMTLATVASDARRLKPEYKVLTVTVEMAEETHSIPLFDTMEMLTDALMDAIGVMVARVEDQ